MNAAWAGASVDPVMHVALRAGLALLLVSAAAHKLRDFDVFVAAVEAYALVPPAWNRSVATVLAGVECLVGAGLVVWDAAVLPALAAAALLGTYTIAVAVNLWRGRRDLACGCGGPVNEVPIGPGLVARNLVLVAACLLAALPPSTRSLTVVDAVTEVGLLVAAACVYAAMETARANAAKLRGLVRVDMRVDGAHVHLAEERP